MGVSMQAAQNLGGAAGEVEVMNHTLGVRHSAVGLVLSGCEQCIGVDGSNTGDRGIAHIAPAIGRPIVGAGLVVQRNVAGRTVTVLSSRPLTRLMLA